MKTFLARTNGWPVPRRGVAAVEFAVLIPFILTLLLGIWEVGRMIEVQQTVNNAAREAARQATTGQLTNTQVQQVAIQCLNVAGIPTGNAVVTVSDLTNPSLDVSQAHYLDRLQVTVTLPFSDVRWSVISYFSSPTAPLSATVTWVTVIDQDFPSYPEPPIG
jgi:Flp pilus assembly protein TadG